MKTHLSHTLLNAVQRLADAPQQTLSRVTARFGSGSRLKRVTSPTPDHVMLRLENVFEAMSELPSQPHIAGALGLACDTLQAELPTQAAAAGLYDIDCDEIHIVAVRGEQHERLRGTRIPRTRCLVGAAAVEGIITRADAPGADWVCGGEGSSVLLCPILHDANLLGVLALGDPLCTAQFDHNDLELVGYVAHQLSAFIQAHRHRAPPPVDAA